MLEMSAQNSLLCFEVREGGELEEESETEGKTVHNGLCVAGWSRDLWKADDPG